MTSQPILIARDLVRHFPSAGGLFRKGAPIRAVDGVSLEVQRGETFAIVGESGCGKSTLARLLLRLIEPTSGQVIYEGEDITAAKPEAVRRLRSRLQIVFQDPFSSLNPRMTIGDLVAEPMLVHGLATRADVREKVSGVLALVGLRPDVANRYPHEFSGGQRQRIGIARALASGPTLLVGDEPISALDVSIRAQILNLLEELKARLGLTLILVSHDLAVVRHTSDRVAVMYLGEIVELAPVDVLFDAPLHPYTQALMAAIPVPDPGARKGRALLEGDPPSPANPPPGCRFHTRCPHANERCRTERPVLHAPDATTRLVACHHASEIAKNDAASPIIAPLSEARKKRIALFASARQTSAAAPQETT
jgi:oligopeptide/dipeptide ABC transporter ATP-binding protein